MGVFLSARRNFFTISSTLTMLAPALSARTEDACTAGPSAMGSVKGMPSSITSAPAAGSFSRIAKLVSMSGSPAVMKGTKAARPSFFSASNLAANLLMRKSGSYFFTKRMRDGKDVLVAASGKAHGDELILLHLTRDPCDMGDGMRRFQRRNDALQLGQQHEGVQRLLVGDGEILHPADILEPAMLRPHAGIVQPRRDG